MERRNDWTQEEIEEVESLEMQTKLMVSGNMDEFAWNSEYSLDKLTKINTFTLKMQYTDIEREDTLRCSLYQDGEKNNYMLLECTHTEIERLHLNNLITMMLSTLRDENVLNELDIENGGDIEDFEPISYLIDAIGKLHCMANMVQQEQE